MFSAISESEGAMDEMSSESGWSVDISNPHEIRKINIRMAEKRLTR